MTEPTLRSIEANGLTFSYLELGTGPLVLCIHGFPDTAHTWSHLMPTLAEQGYRVVAPFTRGYPPTAIPADGDYSALQLGTDVADLITALGEEQAIVIGHDWGALATYVAASLHPERIRKMVTVAIPHPRTLRASLKVMWKSRHFLTFQARRLARWQLSRNQSAYVDDIVKRWSPTWAFGPEETQHVKVAYAKPGAVDAALGYYWSFAASRSDSRVQKLLGNKTTVPTLCVVGADDGALELSAMSYTPRAFEGPYEYEIMAGAGHFLHREKPEEFARLVVDFVGAANG